MIGYSTFANGVNIGFMLEGYAYMQTPYTWEDCSVPMRLPNDELHSFVMAESMMLYPQLSASYGNMWWDKQDLTTVVWE